MASIPCRFSVTCLCDDSPIGNHSSEGPEQVPTYLSLVFPESWDKQGCISLCESTVSQQEADLCALAQAAQCNPPFVTPGTGGDPNDDGGGGGTTIVNTLFYNSEQTCEVSCDEGQAFTFSVPTGTFSALTQEAADARANAYACDKAGDNRVCIGSLSDTRACVGSSYSGTIDVFIASGTAIDTLEITSGALPGGVFMEVTTLGDNNLVITLSGTPTSVGQFDFTILVRDAIGNQQSRDFAINTLEITETTLTDAQVGNNYNQTLTVTGLTVGTVTWAIGESILPTGLTLNASTGNITGIPETAGTYVFDAVFTDDSISCSKQITVEVLDGVPWQNLVWSLTLLEQTGTGLATWIAPGAGAESNAWAGQTSATIAVGVDRGRLTIRGDLVYAGPNRACRITVTVSNNNFVVGQGGSQSSGVDYLLSGVSQATASMASDDFNGVYTLDFTASAGTLSFIIDMFTSNPSGTQANPLNLSVSGIIANL